MHTNTWALISDNATVIYTTFRFAWIPHTCNPYGFTVYTHAHTLKYKQSKTIIITTAPYHRHESMWFKFITERRCSCDFLCVSWWSDPHTRYIHIHKYKIYPLLCFCAFSFVIANTAYRKYFYVDGCIWMKRWWSIA